MDDEYLTLQKILLGAIQANKGVPVKEDDRILFAEGLAVKLLDHTFSINYLYNDTSVPELKLKFFNLASLNIIARAIIENFLVFHYIFIEPTKGDEEDFRFLVYWLSGFVERRNYPIESPQGKKILENEKKIIDNITSKLDNNSFFNRLSEKDKRKILEKGEWRFKNWSEIALSTGLNESNSKAFYKFLCGYAHSGSLSLQQIHQTVSKPEKMELFNATLCLLKIAISNMIVAYCKYFSKAQEYYDQVGIDKFLVELWIDVGKMEMKDIEVDWSGLN